MIKKQMKALLGLSTALMAASSLAGADEMPPERSLSGLNFELIGRADIYSHGSLESYSQAPMLDAMVASGALPAVKDRLPEQPIIFSTGAMVDGVGEYGGVFRHVIGGRPEGWNWMAGQHQGWGGINMAMQECLVRQGPRWQVKAEEQTGPLPNLAQSWSFNADMTELTINLMKGVKWSDGDAFDTEDVRFWYEDNVQDENVASRMAKDSLGGGAALEVIDAHTFKFVFDTPQAETIVENLAYIQGCPGPSHILKDKHPKYNSDATYESYTQAQPNDELAPVVLGAWVPVVHRPDELVIMRRNPYYFKVDESGQQLPYYNEMHFRLSTWGDRTAQAVAGTGDFSNMEDPGNYVEALKQSQDDASPVRANFGPRVLAWRMTLNFDASTAQDDTDQALRTLFREKDFRLALSHALDRDAIGQSVARGPFAYPYIGGFATGSPYYDAASSDYHPFDQAKANALLDAVGATDTDGNGTRNLPGGGDDIMIPVMVVAERSTDTKQLEAVTSQLAEVGIGVIAVPLDETTNDSNYTGGQFTATLRRENVILPTRETCRSWPASDTCPYFNAGGDRLDFETELANKLSMLQASSDAAEQAALARDMQRLVTENAYTIGTIQIPAALLVNKRIKNAHPGTPVFMYEWAEDGVIRERLWTAKTDQVQEVLPGTIAEY
ncbi:MAG: ABC transporter substrate-binding protein [Pelagimonas sp.]|jgi:peptide/nickel transport system substrate-binding protein|nr:ABC transporter substrate-binding protein [Pelagimonas sp.]